MSWVERNQKMPAVELEGRLPAHKQIHPEWPTPATRCRGSHGSSESPGSNGFISLRHSMMQFTARTESRVNPATSYMRGNVPYAGLKTIPTPRSPSPKEPLLRLISSSWSAAPNRTNTMDLRQDTELQAAYHRVRLSLVPDR